MGCSHYFKLLPQVKDPSRALMDWYNMDYSIRSMQKCGRSALKRAHASVSRWGCTSKWYKYSGLWRKTWTTIYLQCLCNTHEISLLWHPAPSTTIRPAESAYVMQPILISLTESNICPTGFHPCRCSQRGKVKTEYHSPSGARISADINQCGVPELQWSYSNTHQRGCDPWPLTFPAGGQVSHMSANCS